MADLIKTDTPPLGAGKEVARGAFEKLVFMTLVALIVAMPEQAHAAAASSTQPWDKAVTLITGVFTGGLARAIAILVVIGLGMSAFFGKLTWKLAAGFIGGIVLIFGAASIADFFIGGIG